MPRPESKGGGGRRPGATGSRRPGSSSSSGRPGSRKTIKKEQKSFFGKWIQASRKLPGDFTRNVEDIVTGMPAGAVATAQALDAALPASPIPHVDEDRRKGPIFFLNERDSKPIKTLGKAMALGMAEDIRHPLRNPANTLLTALAVPSLGAGAGARSAAALNAAKMASRGSKLKSASRAAARKPMKHREVRGIRDPEKILGDRYTIKIGKNLKETYEKKPARSGPKVYLEDTSVNPVLRGARKVTFDALYNASRKRASAQIANPKFKPGAKVVTHGSKEYWNLTRGARSAKGIEQRLREKGVAGVQTKGGKRTVVIDKDQLAKMRGGGYARFIERRTKDKRARYTKQALSPEPKPRDQGAIGNLLGLPMDLLRMNMYASGRYTVQNNVTTALMNMMAGAGARHAKQAVKLRKLNRPVYERGKAVMGASATGSYSAGHGGTGLVGRAARKMGEIASAPEGAQRLGALLRVAEDMNMDEATLARHLENPSNNRAQLLFQRANERVADMSRYGGSSPFGQKEQAFVGSGLPIFYPMTKAFTRYAAKFPAMYPAKAALLAGLGTQGKQLQEEGFGGEVQPYYGYYAPSHKGKSLNPQNISPFAPGGDVLRQVHNAVAANRAEDLPFMNVANQLGPLPEILGAAGTGHDIASGFELKDLENKSALGQALRDSAQHLLPLNEFYFPRESKAHGSLDKKTLLMLRLLGPGLVERPTDYSKVKKSKKSGR